LFLLEGAAAAAAGPGSPSLLGDTLLGFTHYTSGRSSSTSEEALPCRPCSVLTPQCPHPTSGRSRVTSGFSPNLSPQLQTPNPASVSLGLQKLHELPMSKLNPTLDVTSTTQRSRSHPSLHR
ncbi:unnamed protein product, partial [Gulo gulo]